MTFEEGGKPFRVSVRLWQSDPIAPFFSLHPSDFSFHTSAFSFILHPSFSFLRNVKACQGQIGGLGDFNVLIRAHQDCDGMAKAFDEARLVATVEAIGLGAREGIDKEAGAERLGGLRQDDSLTRDGAKNELPLHLLDGIYAR